jgi:hypothetical protein
MEGRIDALCAGKKMNLAALMTRDGVAAVSSVMCGPPQLSDELLYSIGRRIEKVAWLRGRDIGVQRQPLSVPSGKGDGTGAPAFPLSARNR